MKEIRSRFEQALKDATTPQQVEALRVEYVGKKGVVTELRKNVNFQTMTPDERKNFGKDFNDLKTFVESSLAEAAEKVKGTRRSAAALDLTLPGIERTVGALHPITMVQLEVERICQGMGFTVLPGYHVESEWYNFDGLNIPADHPARETQDTFWLTNGRVLRTHTSANQVRALERFGTPLRVIFPGRCFRYEAVDASHDNTFFQVEGLMVERHLSVANLIGIMKSLLSQVFHRDVKVRLRPGFFPFVEPGFELDAQCMFCGGTGCQVCKRSGWIELIPCGLVHPNVLRNGGIDPAEWTGFAFGLGLTRLAMFRFGIPEIRLFNSGDVRFLEQFTAGV